MAEERRLVTVLFADLAGASGPGEVRDPEDVRALQTRYYRIARDVIGAHGGTVEKFIGDAFMAVFGLPQAHGDDAQRAMSAAREIRDRVRAEPRLAAQQTLRIGVNTGEVVATRDDAASDFLITGDAVNVAARLQRAAEPWTILCGERTAWAARDRFTLGRPSEIQVKGKRLPVQALPLLAWAAEATLSRFPLIGRDDDLAQLELVARRAFTDRRPFLVSLVAPAGAGKTRLVEEFLHRLPALSQDATVAIAQCLPYGQRVTYWPLRALLIRLVGLKDEAAPETVREEIRLWLQSRGVGAPERVADLLAATIGAGEPEVIDQAALFAAWRTAIEVAARRSPLVLIFEDLHWSSDSLLDLVEVIVQPRGDAAVLMLALPRPELLDRRPGWGGGRRNYVAMSLEPLDDESVARLVHLMVGSSAPQIVERVVAQAEGNPFFAGEIVQSIRERVGSLTDDAAVGRALATLPDTIQATVLARLDLLGPEERRVLQLGAVFGRAFRGGGIAALGPDLAPDLETLLERLVHKDLIRPAAGDSFTFRHILIREVAYQALLRAERAELHAAAARRLETQAGGREDALAELIAYHFREAATLISVTRTTPLDVAEIRRRAVSWLKRPPDVAAAGAATLGAARHLRAAIERATPDDLPELHERIGDVSGGDEGAEASREALRLCRELGRPADQELRVLGSLLTRYTRFQGTVGKRPSEEEMQQLRADGRALVARPRRAGRRELPDRGRVLSLLARRAGDSRGHRGGGGEHGTRPRDCRPPRRRPAAERRARRAQQLRPGARSLRAVASVHPAAPGLRAPPRPPRTPRRAHDGGVELGSAGRPHPGRAHDRRRAGAVPGRPGALVGAPLRRLARLYPDAPRAVGRRTRRRRARAQDLGRGWAHPGGLLRARLHGRPGHRAGASRDPAGGTVPSGSRRDPEALRNGLTVRAPAAVRPWRHRRPGGGSDRRLRHDSARPPAAGGARAVPVLRPRPAALPGGATADRCERRRRRPEATRGAGSPGPRSREARCR